MNYSPRMHSMSCDFPEGCSCGASEWSTLLDKFDAQRRELAAITKERDDSNSLARNYSERMREAIAERDAIAAKVKELEAELRNAREQLFRAGDSPLAALGCAAENEAALRAELAALRTANERGAEAWEKTQEHLREICLLCGFDPSDGEGTSVIDVVKAVRIHLAEPLAALRAERDELAGWKESAMSVCPPMQEIGQALGVSLGESIHDKILPGILALLADKEWQPIEALPRDGTPVLVWAEPMHAPDIAWHEKSGGTLKTYTHWMAIPKPPNTAEMAIPTWINGSDPDAVDRWIHAKKLQEQCEAMRLSNYEAERQL